MAATAAAKSLQSCLTLGDPIDGSPPGSAIPGILQARTLEWLAISFSNGWKWKVKVKYLSHVRLSNPMNCSLPAFSIHGIFQARVLEWGAIAFSDMIYMKVVKKINPKSCYKNIFFCLFNFIPTLNNGYPISLLWGSICDVYKSNTMLHAINLCSAVCQLHLNKTWRKTINWYIRILEWLLSVLYLKVKFLWFILIYGNIIEN